MISVQDAAVTATFMMEGLLFTNEKLREMGSEGVYRRDIYSIWDQGGLELHIELCQYAELAVKFCDFVEQEDQYGFPGVFDYEVSESFGMWFGEFLFETGSVPTFQTAKDHLARSVAMFFTQSDEDKLAPGLLYNKLMVNA